MSEGSIYILVNQSMPGYIKIGMTSSTVADRMRSLDGTGIPLPFECFYAVTVENMELAEKKIHDAFGDYRVRKNREFFTVSPDRVKSILELIGKDDVTPKSDIVENLDDQGALDAARKRKSIFSFDVVNIPVNAELVSIFSDTEKCVVSGRRKVIFRDKETSLSDAAMILAREHGYQWRTINGPMYWTYNGKTLPEIREEVESGTGDVEAD
ncbi:GIY-YIG nuclease family protein [Novispirillum itersonii]|uniref:GIY-YIG nuclease family protein n=1 Tax=Novispirillum itersonii TaxID=189 RepID=UPI0005C260F1|nr:GIY-YIG nuclease family protein [Novispirillum itersonii]